LSLTGVASCASSGQGYVQSSVSAAFSMWSDADLIAIVPNASATNYNVGQTGNTDLCRLYHLTVASEVPSHCSHGDLLGANQCGNITLNACGLINQACGNSVYDSAGCAADVAPLFPNKTGSPTDTSGKGDTLSCRLYNAGVALAIKKGGMGNTTGPCAALKACFTSGAPTVAPTAAPTPLSKSSSSVVVVSSLGLVAFLAI